MDKNTLCECLDYCEKADPFSVTPKGKCREESAVEVCENGADTRTKHVSPALKSCGNYGG